MILPDNSDVCALVIAGVPGWTPIEPGSLEIEHYSWGPDEEAGPHLVQSVSVRWDLGEDLPPLRWSAYTGNGLRGLIGGPVESLLAWSTSPAVR